MLTSNYFLKFKDNDSIDLCSHAQFEQFLSPSCLKTLVYAFINFELDHANSLYLGAHQYSIEPRVSKTPQLG